MDCIGEIGGFYSPSGTYDFSRTYANGAGFAKGTQQVSGQQGYGFGRIGALVNVTPADEFSPSLEIGRPELADGLLFRTLLGDQSVRSLFVVVLFCA